MNFLLYDMSLVEKKKAQNLFIEQQSGEASKKKYS